MAELETKLVMKALVGARTALAELKQAGELIPNQAILINTLPVLEARASSEIENIVTTPDPAGRRRLVNTSVRLIAIAQLPRGLDVLTAVLRGEWRRTKSSVRRYIQTHPRSRRRQPC